MHPRNPVRSALRALLALAFSALPLAAEGPIPQAEEPPATFLIETITVEGLRHASPDLIVAESLLTAGRSYGEGALRQGVYRIKRLPFIVDASFALRKGSERGKYALVITVSETRFVFLGADALFSKGKEWGASGTGTVGARAFLGARGVAFAALRGDALQMGYTHYNLLDRGVFASLEYGRSSSCCEGLTFAENLEAPEPSPPRSTSEGETLSLTLGVPLARSHSLKAQIAAFRGDFISPEVGDPSGGPTGLRLAEDLDSWHYELAWTYDTTDDPLRPTRGRLLTVGAAADRTDARSRLTRPGVPLPESQSRPARAQRDSAAVTVGFRQVWPLSSRDSWSLAVGATAIRTEAEGSGTPPPARRTDDESLLTESWIGYSRSLLTGESARRVGDLWLEVRARPSFARSGGGSLPTRTRAAVDADAALVLRNSWGVVRVALSYRVEDAL